MLAQPFTPLDEMFTNNSSRIWIAAENVYYFLLLVPSTLSLLVWVFHAKGWAELSKHCGCVNKLDEIKRRWNRERFSDTSVWEMEAAQGWGRGKVPLSPVILSVTSRNTNREMVLMAFSIGTLIPITLHLSLLQNYKINLPFFFFLIKQRSSETTHEKNFAQSRKSQTFKGHNRSQKNIDTVKFC